MANIKYADSSYTDTNATDDDRVMLRTGAGADARAPLVQPKGYIDGLRMVWVSGTQIQVTAGAAYIPGPKRIVELSAAVTKTPALAASTWYHLYLYLSGSVADIEVVTTAPASSYSGVARTKTGDTSRRYIGSIRTKSDGSLFKFDHDVNGTIEYIENISSNDFLMYIARPTSAATVSLDSRSPITRSAVLMQYLNLCDKNAYISSTNGPAAVDGSWRDFIPPSQKSSMPLALPNGQDMTVIVPSATSGAIYIWISGYRFNR